MINSTYKYILIRSLRPALLMTRNRLEYQVTFQEVLFYIGFFQRDKHEVTIYQ